MIIHYREINEYLLATGFEQPSGLADFFVLSFDEITDSSVEFMPPYQKDFYQITLLISGVSDTSIEIDTERVDRLENSLFFCRRHMFMLGGAVELLRGILCILKESF